MEEDWQVICEHSLFSNRLNQLELICNKDFNGSNDEFIEHYLKPVVELLDTIRSRCEDYYGLKSKKQKQTAWTNHFENIVKYAIHPTELDIVLHKGDYYIHISSTLPRTLVLKYYHSGELHSRNLSMTDSILMCSENWTELLKSELRDRFVFTSCILWTVTGFEKVYWVKLLRTQINDTMESIQTNSTMENIQTNSTKENIQAAASSDINDQSTATLSEPINIEEFTMKPLLILDLNFELLHSQVVYLPGSQDQRGGPVIFFDASKQSWQNADVNSEELAKLLTYFIAIPRDTSQQKGCSLVIDTREGEHTKDILECIGEAIVIFQTQAPGCVHMAYVLTKKDSLMLLLTASKIKERLNFEFQFVSSLDKLHRDISIDQIPTSLGGTMKYSHEQWIKFRTKVEPFMTGCRSAAKHAMNYIQDLNKANVGQTYLECQHILATYNQKVTEVLEDTRLLALKTEGKELIDRLCEGDEDLHHTDDFQHTIECLNRLYNQMSRVFDRLKDISDQRISNLKLCLHVRKYEEETQIVLNWIQHEGLPYLDKHKDIADSIGHASSLMEEFDKFSEKSTEILQKHEELVKLGQYLIDLEELEIDRNLLNDKNDELTHVCNEYKQRYNDRKKKLTQCIDFHTFVQETTKWWMCGMQHIAHMNMEEIQTLDGIERLKSSIQEFIMKNPPMRESRIVRITELAHHLGCKQVEQAEQIKSQCLEVQQMLKVKQNQIVGAESRYRKLHRDSLIYSEGDENSSGFKDDDLSSEQSDDEYDNEPTDDVINEYATESIGSLENQYGVNIFSWKDNQQPYDENDAKLAVFDAAMPTKMKERLRHIIDEMITTEHEYVSSLEYILENYLTMMDREELPPTLKGKKNVLFGNVKRIYDFHQRFFSQEIETFRHAPLQIGKCFLKWERQFYLYALYNKNKPKSDQLWDDFANTYFQTKLKELKDKLDLASYLIKPVQRLGKYALLLKDMISCCDEKDPRVIEMKAAHELMKFQLRHGNDLLAMDAIQDSDINLKDQGCLLRQGDFLVWYGKRKRVRRIFLFEHVVVFCKAKKQKAKNDYFTYKHSLKMVDVGLTENIGDSGLKFEVWYRRWKKGRAAEAFIVQAVTETVKNAWTTDISRILWRQATRNKEYGITEATTGISVESTPSSILFDNGGNNSNYTRSRTMDLASPREMTPNNKRLSWLSAGESSGSSGVFDLGSLPEDGHALYSPRDDSRVFFKRGDVDVRYGSLPRKKLQYSNQQQSPSSETSSNTASTRKDSQASVDTTFIRNNVYRKTFQLEGDKAERTKAAQRKKQARRANSISGGRYATQPIVLPSSGINYVDALIQPGNTNSLTRSRTKKVSADGPLQAAISESLEDSLHITDSSNSDTSSVNTPPLAKPVLVRRHSNSANSDYVIMRSNSKNNRDKTLRHSKSFTDCSYDFSAGEVIISNNRAFSETPPPLRQKAISNLKRDDSAKTKRYSFTKSMTVIDMDTIGSRNNEILKLNRERSLSSTDNSVFAVDQPKLKLLPQNKTKTSASTVSIAKQKNLAEVRKKPFQNLKKKISKSLSEI